MPAYDTTYFDPPAPLARVILRCPETGATCPDVPMLIDSGSDVTILPRSAIESLGLAVVPEKRYELVGFDDNIAVVAVADLDVIFLGRTFRGRFPLHDREWGILGRNVLNELVLLFDGPGRRWKEQPRRSRVVPKPRRPE